MVNALIHRDYSVIGSEVHVDIYDDRLEIYSPGGMYDGTFIQDINPLTVSSARRNPVLADLFVRMDLMERRGSGLRKIIEAYSAEEKYKEELKPEFRSTESSFITILKNLNYYSQNVTQNVTQVLNPDERRKQIIRIMENNPEITSTKLSKKLLVSISIIERDLKKLTDDKLIEYLGSAKNGY